MLVRSVHWALLLCISRLVTGRNHHVAVPDHYSYERIAPTEEAVSSQPAISNTKVSKMNVELVSSSPADNWHPDPGVRVNIKQTISESLCWVSGLSVSNPKSGTPNLLESLLASVRETGVSGLPSTTLIPRPKGDDSRNSKAEPKEKPALEQSHMTILTARQIYTGNATINATNDTGSLGEISRTSTNPLRDAFNPFVGNIGPFLDSATDITVNKRPEKKIYGTLEIFFVSHHLRL